MGGRQVMPSTHSYMLVSFAIRKSDRVEVVVKRLARPDCFKGSTDERNWRRSTEFLLNMQTAEDSGLCKILDVIEEDTAMYVIMEKVDGMDLHETIAGAGGLLPLETTRDI